MLRYPMTPESAKAISEEFERWRKARQERKRARVLARELNAAMLGEQGPAQPRAHWRWPMGIGAHAIALCALAAAAALGVLAHALSGSTCTDWPEPATLGPVFVRV